MNIDYAQGKIDALFRMLSDYGQGDYIGESISQIAHCIQAANCAREAGASDTTILAALLHDCGQILPSSVIEQSADLSPSSGYKMGQDMLLSSGSSVGRYGHDQIGAAYLSSLGFPPEVCELVRDHVVAKRYLTAVEEGYHDSLSEASKKSLLLQGGPFSLKEVAEFENDHLFHDKIMLRRFDDRAKVVGAQVPGLDSYKALAVRVLAGVAV